MAELKASMQDGAGKDMLEEGGSLPKVFEEVFSDVAREASALWRLDEGLEDEVGRLRGFMGLADEKWEVKREGQVKGARKAWNKLRGRATPGGRGPIIGVHIRGGDKAPEYAHDLEEMGISNTFGNISTYVKAADDGESTRMFDGYI